MAAELFAPTSSKSFDGFVHLKFFLFIASILDATVSCSLSDSIQTRFKHASIHNLCQDASATKDWNWSNVVETGSRRGLKDLHNGPYCPRWWKQPT